MNISFDVEPEMCLFKDLEAGDCFTDTNSNSVYMKIVLEENKKDKDLEDTDKEEYYLVVNLVTGKIVKENVFFSTTKVRPQRSAIIKNLER